MKVSFVITAIILIIILILGGIFFFFKEDVGPLVPEPLKNLFPSDNREGSGTATNTFPTPSQTQENTGGALSGSQLPALRNISEVPVAGGVVFSENGKDTIRYVERETGHVFDAKATSTEGGRVTNTTIPRIQEALWAPDGTRVVLRYLGEDAHTIETFLARVTEGEEDGALVGNFLPRSIDSFIASPSEETFFYIQKQGGGYEGIEIDAENETTRVRFQHSFGEWNPLYTYAGDIALLSKPSAEVEGFLYTLNQGLRRVLGNIEGLTATISAEGSYILYSESSGGRFVTKVLDEETGEVMDITPRTLPEKCVWHRERESILYCFAPQSIPPGAYPNVWYQGAVSFNDSLWEIDVETGASHMLLDLEQRAGGIDGYRPYLSQSNQTLIFINKKDASLWSYRIEEDS